MCSTRQSGASMVRVLAFTFRSRLSVRRAPLCRPPRHAEGRGRPAKLRTREDYVRTPARSAGPRAGGSASAGAGGPGGVAQRRRAGARCALLTVRALPALAEQEIAGPEGTLPCSRRAGETRCALGPCSARRPGRARRVPHKAKPPRPSAGLHSCRRHCPARR